MTARQLLNAWQPNILNRRCCCWLHEGALQRASTPLPRLYSSCSRPSPTTAASAAAAPANDSPPLPVADLITSPANSYIRHCVKLRESARYRQQQRRVLLVGRNLLQELAAVKAGVSAAVLFLKEGAPPPPPGVAAQATIQVSPAVMRKLAGLEEASGTDLAAELPLPPPLQLEVSGGEQQQQAGQQGQQQGQQQAGQQQGQRQQGQQQQQQQQGQGQQVAAAPMSQLQRLLVLEGVQDPGNLGTLLRCATAFGWDGVWLLPGCCDPFNDKALRASRGAALRLPLVSGDWQQLERVATDNGLMLLAAEPEDPDQQQQQQQETGGGHKQQQQQQQVGLGRQQEQHSSKAAGAGWLQELRQQRIALVLGTEGQGLSQRALAACRPVSVPMTGDMESLNVGIAGGILMFLLSEGLQPMLGTLERLGSAAVTRRDCF